MKPLLLTAIIFTGAVRSRSIWQIFDHFFGNEIEHHEENSILHDDEDGDERKSNGENSVDKEEYNDIPYWNVIPHTHEKEGKHIDNRVGVLHPLNHSAWTDEGYKKILEELDSYIKNLSSQDNGFGEGAGPAYTHLHMSFGRYDEYGYFVGEGGGAFDDFDDPDYDIDNVYPVFSDDDSDYGHDELK